MDPVLLENGTPQGCVLSPLLFLVMMRDLPSDENFGIRTSVFADDVAVWISGKDSHAMHDRLQTRLNEIHNFFIRWGFKLSTGKSVAVCFTKSNPFRHATPDLKIDGQTLCWKEEVTFLGITFDSKLCWKNHIDKIVDRCKKRLNIMRAMTGQSWGCSKKTLMLFYRCSIRSVIEYGCEAFDSATSSSKTRLDRLQYSALKSACGAMTSTSLAALQVECGELPLDLRRKMLIANFASKTKTIFDHPCRDIFVPARGQAGQKWRYFFHRKVKESEQPAARRTCVLNEMVDRLQPVEMVLPTVPPWTLIPPLFDEGLVGLKKDDPSLIPRAMEILNSYRDYTCVYTDASKIDDKVAIGYYVSNTRYESSQRVTDNVSIFTAELTAIKTAIEWMANSERETRFALFTDSYSSVQALRYSANTSKSPLIAETLTLISNEICNGKQVTIIWVPSHVGIHGNEVADRLARGAIRHQNIELVIPPEIDDLKRIIKKEIIKEWQNRWNSTPGDHHYRSLEARVSGGFKFETSNRKKEVLISRLRLGKCGLNHYLHVMGLHDTGLCENCGTKETIEHWLLNCRKTSQLRARIKRSQKTKNPATLGFILNSPQCQDLIFQWAEENQLRL